MEPLYFVTDQIRNKSRVKLEQAEFYFYTSFCIFSPSKVAIFDSRFYIKSWSWIKRINKRKKNFNALYKAGGKIMPLRKSYVASQNRGGFYASADQKQRLPWCPKQETCYENVWKEKKYKLGKVSKLDICYHIEEIHISWLKFWHV